MKCRYGQERKRQNSTEINFLFSKTQKNIHFYIEVDVFRANGIISFRPLSCIYNRKEQVQIKAIISMFLGNLISLKNTFQNSFGHFSDTKTLVESTLQLLIIVVAQTHYFNQLKFWCPPSRHLIN